MDIICDVISYSSVRRCSICVNTVAISLPKLYQEASQGKEQGCRKAVRAIFMEEGGIQALATHNFLRRRNVSCHRIRGFTERNF